MGPDAAAAPSPPLPLQDRRIVVTRAEDGAGGLARLLRERGAHVVELPLVRILPPRDSAPLARAAARLSRYDWLVFTSANAVRALREALPPGEPAAPPRWIAAVGPATAHAVTAELGWGVTAVPDTFAGDAVAAAMAAVAPLPGRSVLWPRAADARPVLREQLEAAGARLEAPEAYRSEALHDAALEVARLVTAAEVDAVTFTSPSAVRAYAAAGGGAGTAAIAVIGPTTAAAARAAGIPVHVQPAQHTFAALVEALTRYLPGARGEAAAEATERIESQ